MGCAARLRTAGGLVKPVQLPFQAGLNLTPVPSSSFSYFGVGIFFKKIIRWVSLKR